MGYRNKYARKIEHHPIPSDNSENKLLIRILLLITILLFSFIIYLSGGIEGFIRLL